MIERSCPAVDQFADLADRAGKQECVVHHDFQISPLCQLDQFLSLLCCCRKRLFYEHVLSVLKRFLCQLEMGPDRRDYGNRVDIDRS
jgi:hypothetical protein